MEIKEKYVLKFQRLYKKVYREKISYEEALSQCIALVRFCTIASKPITKDDLELLPN